MKMRLIIAGVVFVGGFGIGLGATYALLAKKPAPPPPEASNEADAGGDDAGAPKAEPKKAIAPKSAAPKVAAPKPVAPKPSEEAKPAQPIPSDPTPLPVAPAEPPKPVEVKVVDPPVETPPAEVAPKANGAWWEGLAGKTCRVDLGAARVLVIRKGKLDDKQVVEWDALFGQAPRIGAIAKGDNPVVTVHGVGMDARGTPAAAFITFEKQGQSTSGVIALRAKGLKVTLYPVDATKPSP